MRSVGDAGNRQTASFTTIPDPSTDSPQNKGDTSAAGRLGRTLLGAPDPLIPDVPKDGGQAGAGNTAAPPGAPELSPPKKQMDPQEIAILVTILISKMDDAQSQSEQQSLNVDEKQRQAAFKRANDLIEEATKKIQEAQKNLKTTSTLGTIAKVLAGVAAIALTLTTGGLAAPLAIAIIAYTAVDTALTISDSISTANGGPRLDLSDLLNEGFTKLAKAAGADDETAAKAGQWGSFAVQAAIAVVTIACSFASIGKMAKDASSVGGLAMKLGGNAFKGIKIAGIVTQFVGGATQFTSAVYSVKAAAGQRDVDTAKGKKEQEDAAIAIIAEMVRNTLDRLEQIAADLASAMKSAGDTVRKVSDTNITLAGGNTAMV